MANLLAKKSAIITGGVTGIGRAIALESLRQGASVTVNYLDNEASQRDFESLRQQAPDQKRLFGFSGDIGIKATGTSLIDAAVNASGDLNVFVANAGVSQLRDFLSLDNETFEGHFHTNIRGTFLTTQAAARQMVKQGRGGSMIGVASISAQLGGAQQVH